LLNQPVCTYIETRLLKTYKKCKHQFSVFWNGNAGFDVWTAGTNDGIGCIRKHGWCPSGQLVHPGINFGAGEKSNMAVENGLAIYLLGNPATANLRDWPEGARLKFMCEV
jgi:hypothetical protein